MDTYHIRIDGHLDPSWAEWLGMSTLRHLPDGSTELIGHMADQSALFGALVRLRDLGCTLVEVRRAVGHGQ